MKKFLSCVLAMALIFSLMSVTVFAGTELHPNLDADKNNDVAITPGTQYSAVGNHAAPNGEQNNYTDGVEKFGPQGATSDVSVSFNHTTEDGEGNIVETDILIHRYAFDIEYKELVINLGDVITTTTGSSGSYDYHYQWNVNTYQYDLVGQNGEIIDPETVQTLDLDAPYVFDAYKLYNHSDKSISCAAVADLGKNSVANANMTLVPTVASVEVGPATATVKNDDGSIATQGRFTDINYQTLTATPNADWLTTVNNLIAGGISQETVVGTLTLTITPTDSADLAS